MKLFYFILFVAVASAEKYYSASSQPSTVPAAPSFNGFPVAFKPTPDSTVYSEVLETDKTLTFLTNSDNQNFKSVASISNTPYMEPINYDAKPGLTSYEVPILAPAPKPYPPPQPIAPYPPPAPPSSYGAPPPPAPPSTYGAPLPTVQLLSQPIEAAPLPETYNTPIKPVESYSAPKPVESYSAPISKPLETYNVPAKPVETYVAPISKPSETYNAPAKPFEAYIAPVARPSETYNAPIKPVDSYSAPIAKPLEAYISPARRPSEPFTAPRPTSVVRPNNFNPDTLDTNAPIDSLNLPVNSQISILDKDNQYTHAFSLDDGTKVSENGKLISTDDGWEYVIAKKGSYEYISPEGTPIKVNWVADENGYRAMMA